MLVGTASLSHLFLKLLDEHAPTDLGSHFFTTWETTGLFELPCHTDLPVSPVHCLAT